MKLGINICVPIVEHKNVEKHAQETRLHRLGQFLNDSHKLIFGLSYQKIGLPYQKLASKIGIPYHKYV